MIFAQVMLIDVLQDVTRCVMRDVTGCDDVCGDTVGYVNRCVARCISAHVFTANHMPGLSTATLSIDQSNPSPGFLNFQRTIT